MKNKNSYKKLVKSARNIMFWELGERQDFVYVSSSFLELSGFTNDDLIQTNIQKIIYPEDLQIWQNLNNKSTQATQESFRVIAKTGQTLYLNASIMLSEDDAGAHKFQVLVIDKSTEAIQKKVISQLQSINQAILSTLSESLIIVDLEGRICSISPGFFKMWQLRKDNFEGNLFEEIKKRIIEHIDLDKSKFSVDDFSSFQSDRKKKKVLKLFDGRIIEKKSAPYHSQGKVEGWCWYFKDITNQLNLVEKLGKLAFRDSLTTLYNRRWCEKKLKQTLSKEPETPVAFLYMDLDHFKVINDSCGHYHGDKVLEEIGRLLLGVVGKKSYLSRLGGDEFGLIIKNKSAKKVLKKANKIKDAISKYSYQWKDKFFKIGVSIGVVFVESGDSLKSIFVHADEACYVSKDTGRNKCVVYNSEKEEFKEGKTHLKWYDLIQKALLRSRFELWCQPIIDLEDSSSHYEVLLRMMDDEGNVVSPSKFMGAGERFGLIFAIDKWVISHFCKFYSDYAHQLQDRLFSINISGQSLSRKQFLNHVLGCLETYKVNPQAICFEITESEIINNFEKALEFIGEVKKLGCKISLDDFGKGLTSFSYLKNIPFDHIKIDGQFIKGFNADKINHAIVNAIVNIADVIDKKTIAEHIESEESLNQMSSLGVDYFQGYYLSKPHPMSKLIE